MAEAASKGARRLAIRIIKLPVIAVGVIVLTLLEFAGWACAVCAVAAALMTLGAFLGYMNGSLDGIDFLITLAVAVPVMVGAALFMRYNNLE